MAHPLHKKCQQGIMKVNQNQKQNKQTKKDNNNKYPVPDNYHASQ